MKIWVDADACPKAVKEIVFRAADKRHLEVVLVANMHMFVPRSEYISLIVVEKGPDVADQKIVELVSPDDLVITADIPLAAAIVEKGAVGLNPRGEEYTEENVRERLSMRDFMADLRDAGEMTGGPKAYGTKDKQKFASAFDRFVTRAR